jgi:ABC-type bacteriocin/lantibiotic exporter with double-glycine peptidase domain
MYQEDASGAAAGARDAGTRAGDAGAATRGDGGFPESERLPYEPDGHVFGQANDASCVAACARMVLSDSGVDVPEAYVRDATGVDPSGGSIRDIPGAFDELGGPRVVAEEDGTIEDLQRATSGGNPAIVSIAQGTSRHAVVVDGFQETDIGLTALIRDPLPVGEGSADQILLETFRGAWNGRHVHFQPLRRVADCLRGRRPTGSRRTLVAQ